MKTRLPSLHTTAGLHFSEYLNYSELASLKESFPASTLNNFPLAVLGISIKLTCSAFGRSQSCPFLTIRLKNAFSYNKAGIWQILTPAYAKMGVNCIKRKTMLRWTVTFLVIAIIAAIFGFGNIAAGAASIAKILFYIFVVLFVLSLLFGKKIFK